MTDETRIDSIKTFYVNEVKLSKGSTVTVLRPLGAQISFTKVTALRVLYFAPDVKFMIIEHASGKAIIEAWEGFTFGSGAPTDEIVLRSQSSGDTRR